MYTPDLVIVRAVRVRDYSPIFFLCNSEIFRLIQVVFIIQLTQVLDEIPVIIYATLFV